MDNMKIYNATRKVPDEAQKSFNNGRFSGTDINPMWRIKTLTEQFGPAGIGWYYKVLSERSETHGGVTVAVVDLELYIKVAGEWSMPIYGTGGNVLLDKNGKTSDEGYKMALTDALSVACKALGIGADIYFAKDKTKYTQEPPRTPQDDAGAQGGTEIPAAGKGPVCEACGAPIGPWVVDGEVKATAEDFAENTKKTYGKALCMRCAKRAKRENNGG